MLSIDKYHTKKYPCQHTGCTNQYERSGPGQKYCVWCAPIVEEEKRLARKRSVEEALGLCGCGAEFQKNRSDQLYCINCRRLRNNAAKKAKARLAKFA